MEERRLCENQKYGRADINQEWSGEEGLEAKWLSSYINKKISEFSINVKVTAEDEWIAEAYLETNYKNLTTKDFEQRVREYQAFKMENGL